MTAARAIVVMLTVLRAAAPVQSELMESTRTMQASIVSGSSNRDACARLAGFEGAR